jgi:hypothetical protein
MATPGLATPPFADRTVQAADPAVLLDDRQQRKRDANSCRTGLIQRLDRMKTLDPRRHSLFRQHIRGRQGDPGDRTRADETNVPAVAEGQRPAQFDIRHADMEVGLPFLPIRM